MNSLSFRRPALRWATGVFLLLGCAAFAFLRAQGSRASLGQGLFAAGDPARVSGRSPTATRSLKLEQESVDFGVLPIGETRSLGVLVSNPGRRPVRVLQVTSECVCVKGRVDSSMIDPGAKVELTVQFRAIPGKSTYRSSVSMITDEEGPSRYDVAVAAKVSQEYVLEPEMLDFGRIPKGGVSRKEVRITRQDGATFSISSVAPSRPDLSWTWRPIDSGPKPGFVIEAAARGDRAGARAEAVKIETSTAPESGAVLQVALEVESSFVCSPATVSASYGPDGHPGGFETVIRGKEGQEVKVESVQDTWGTSLEFDARPSKNSECALTIKLTGELAPDRHLGSFQVKVKGEDQPLSLPYRVELEALPEKR